MNNPYAYLMNSHRIIVDGVKVQRRKHKKKRINKKWAKLHGFKYISMFEDGQVVVIGDSLYMNTHTYELLTQHVLNKSKISKLNTCK